MPLVYLVVRSLLSALAPWRSDPGAKPSLKGTQPLTASYG